MHIRQIDHWTVYVPFTETIAWGSGKRSGTTRLISRIECDDGLVGWGETLCLIDTVPAVFEHAVKPIGLGYDVCRTEQLHRHVLGAGYYHHKRAAVMAICALEMAMWDAKGRMAGLPLHQMWGGQYRDNVQAAAYTFTRDPGELRDRLLDFVAAGHTTFKVKIGFDRESDIALARTARDAVGTADLRFDVNGAWTPGTAKRQLSKIAEYDPAYVEQPLELDDLDGHAALRHVQPVPIALDESAYTLQDVSNIIQAKAADVVLLDPHQAGGLWQVVKAAALCEARGIPVGLHSGGELAISQAAYIHLAASIPNLSVAIDTEWSYLSEDVCPKRPVLTSGAFDLPSGPGLGITPDIDRIKDLETDRIEGAYLDPSQGRWFPIKPAY